ncbi:ALF repeat-containing protein [Streptomyces sp. NPDC054956]
MIINSVEVLLVKLSRIAAAVVAVAVAPSVLLASPAFAADSEAAAPVPASAPDGAPAGRPADQAAQKDAPASGRQAEDDKAAIELLMAQAKPGSALREDGAKAIAGGAAAMRAFLETGQHEARDQDNRLQIAQILGKAQSGPGVTRRLVEAGRAALRGSAADRVAFLATGQYAARDSDNRVWIVQILSKAQAGTGVNRGVIEAGEAALNGSAADRVAFLETGRFKVRADDIRVELARMESKAGPALAAGIAKMFDSSPTLDELEHFLAVTQFELRDEDNSVAISKIINAGGPEVAKAGKAALKGSAADREAFLATGQHEARAKDAKAAEQTGTGQTGTGQTGTGAQQVVAVTDQKTGTGTTVTTQSATGTLASTGADPLWASTGAGGALVAGAGLMLAARMRRAGSQG